MISTIGYERASLADFVETLKLAEVDVLVDIRDRAQSRRKGFSKTALGQELNANGINYVHFRQLGDPKAGRDAARAGNWKKFDRIYRAVLATPDAQAAIRSLAEMAGTSHICLLCYERDHRTCHRKYVSDDLEGRLDTKAMHLGVQPSRVAA